MKTYHPDVNVLDAARNRISYTFDHFDRVYVSFSGGKDSTVLLHLVMDEAIKRNRRVGVLIVDLEAQYTATVDHMQAVSEEYREHIDLHWCCLPMSLRNAVTNYEPRWTAWDPDQREIWVRDLPKDATTEYPWYQPGMEFEEFVVLWGLWYSQGERTAGFVGIRADESLNRYRTVAVWDDKQMYQDKRWTTLIEDQLFNVYPIYDWKTADIWRYHARFPNRRHNEVYDLMHRAGVPLSQQRLCQPFGDDQRKGLWLYHVLEPRTWFKLIARVNGANSGAFYTQERGNVSGYAGITKPEGHTWKSFAHLLLSSMPENTREHYVRRFKVFIKGWQGRGYDTIPDEAPRVLEEAHWAPSWRRMCKCLLRNDYWCKGLGLQQPKSDAYGKYLEIKRAKKALL